MNKYELLRKLESKINDELKYKLAREDYEGMTRDEIIEDFTGNNMHEIIDENIPIYYSYLASLLANDIRFADVDDPGLLPENPTVWNIISVAVYEYLNENFQECVEEALTELLPDLE